MKKSIILIVSLIFCLSVKSQNTVNINKNNVLNQKYAGISRTMVNGQKFVQIDKSVNGQTIDLADDEVLEVKLPCQPSTGYAWKPSKLNSGVIVQKGEYEFIQGPVKNLPGQMETVVYRFAGASHGTTELRMESVRAWEKNSPPIDKFRVNLNSKGNYTGTYIPIQEVPKPFKKQGSLKSKGLPSEFNWEHYCTPVKDQGACGACWAFAANGVFEALINIQDGVQRNLSEQWLINCDTEDPIIGKSTDGCQGGTCPFDYFLSPGAVYWSELPYTSGDCSTRVNSDCECIDPCGTYVHHEQADDDGSVASALEVGDFASDDEIKTNLLEFGPIFCSIDSHFMESYTGGILTSYKNSWIDHAVVIVGYKDSTALPAGGYWIVRNSWGPTWGEHGYMRIEYDRDMVGFDSHYLKYKSGINFDCGSLFPGVTVSDKNPVCPSDEFKLSTNTYIGKAATFQWQKSTNNGSSWSNINGATNCTYNTTQTVETLYRCSEGCNGSNIGFSTPVDITMDNNPIDCYCLGKFYAGSWANTNCGFDFGHDISLVEFPADFNYPYGDGKIVNVTGPYCYFPYSYRDFVKNPVYTGSQVAKVNTGQTYKLLLKSDYIVQHQTTYYGIWIDWNNSGDFADYSGKFYQTQNRVTADSTAATVLITVPFWAKAGNHRMRIRAINVKPNNIAACFDYNEGEQQDYLINVKGSPCQGKPNPGNTKFTQDFPCNTSDYNAAVYNLYLQNIIGSGTSRQWQFSADNKTWTNIPVGGTDSTLIVSDANTWYRCKVTCNSTGQSGISTPLFLNAINCYCLGHYKYCGTKYGVNIMMLDFAGIIKYPADVCKLPYNFKTYIGDEVFRVNPGQSYPMQITNITSTIQTYWGIWIDWDNSGSFTDNPAKYTVISAYSGAINFTADIKVPTWATGGNHTMRIKSMDTNPGYKGACSDLDYGEQQDYTVFVISCSGTPKPGNTLTSPDYPVCTTQNLKLSLQNNTSGGGVTYQWMSAPYNNRNNWTNINGATSATYSLKQTTDTYYECQVSCQGNPAISNPVLVLENNPCYCLGSYTNCGNVSGAVDITNVKFGDINNSPPASYCNPPYNFRSFIGGQSATVLPGQSYPITISTSKNISTEYWGIWIDWNNTGNFSDYYNKFTLINNSSGGTTFTGTITVPALGANGSTIGTHRMRIRASNTSMTFSSSCANLSFGEQQDYIVNITSCNGTPNPGNTLSTSNQVCLSTSFTLSMQNIVGVGATYQWYSRTTPLTYFLGKWTKISGATNPTFTTTQTANTWYDCGVTCSGYTAFSMPLEVTMNVPCYCLGTYKGCGSSIGSNISNVAFGSIQNNITLNCNNPPSYYSDYTNLSTDIIQGQSYPISITSSNKPYTYWGIWIDWNNSGSFTDDPKKYTVIHNSYINLTGTGTISVPATATLGNHRMRIRALYLSDPGQANVCATFDNGEQRDYTVNVISSNLCSGTPNPGNTVSSVNPVCSSETFILSLSNYTSGAYVSYQWMKSSDNTAWTNISGATNNTYLTSQVASTYYLCKVSCSGNAKTSNSLLVSSTLLCSCLGSYNNCGESMGIDIVNVNFGNINQYTGADCNQPPFNYTQYTGAKTSVAQGRSYPISISADADTYTTYWGIWIDWDYSGSFTDNPNKYTVISNLIGQTPTGTGTIVVPSNAVPGNHLMRIRASGSDPGIANACNKLLWGEQEDYGVDVISSTCNGIPSPGKTISSAATVCATESFTLSLQNSIFGTGLTFQWQSSPDGSSWTNITGANDTIYTTSQTSATWYQCKATCSGITGISVPLEVGFNSFCYCTGSYNICLNDYGIDITNVTFGDINNTTAGYCNLPYNYNDYTALSTSIKAGQSYEISVSSDPAFQSVYWGIWIDWNNTGSFTDDPNDYTVLHNLNLNGVYTTTATGTITVPSGAKPGNHLMRIRAAWPSDPGQANVCATFEYGETEDYTVNVVGPCNGSPAPGNTLSTEYIVCPSDQFTLSIQNSVPALGLSYQWDSSPDNITWTNISGATDNTYTANQSTATWYQCEVSCSGITGISNPLQVTMNAPTSCYCSGTYDFCGSDFGIDISNVTFVGINNSTLSYCNLPKSYTDYTSDTATVYTNQTYTISATTDGNYNPVYWGIWIDWNNTGSFTDDPNDYTVIQNSSLGNGYFTTTGTGTITVPAYVIQGNHRMRVRAIFKWDPTIYGACNDFMYGETEDYIVKVIASACYGTPNPGNTIALNSQLVNVSSVCSEDTFNLSLQNTIQGSGVTYQWESSNNNITWTNITGATGLSYTASQTSATWYKCAVSCSGNTGFSSPVQINMNSPLNCYCKGDYGFCASGMGIEISNVTFGFINNTTGSYCSSNPPYYNYTDFTGLSTTVSQGNSYPISITGDGTSLIYWGIWIDWNNTGSFIDDPNDYSVINNSNGNPTGTGMITVPVYAAQGYHRMRIRANYNSNPGQANVCSWLGQGNQQDYSVFVLSNPCIGTPAPGNTESTLNSVCPSDNFTLSLQNQTPGSGLTYQWQSSPDNITWTNLSSANSSSYLATQTAGTWYKCYVGCSGNDGISTPVFIPMKSVTSCYCVGTYKYCGISMGSEIRNVTFGTINNAIPNSCNLPYSYNDFTGLSTAVSQGLTYPISVSSDFSSIPTYWGIWIDWDNSGSFTDNVNKYTVINNFSSGSLSKTGTGIISVPSNATLGNHRMRIRANSAADPGQSNVCSDYGYGEQQDYTVNVISQQATFKISGTVTYDNNNNTPIINTMVYLENSGGKKLDSMITDISGLFKFQNLLNGTYKLVCGKTPMKWGGANPLDALTVNRYFINLITAFGDAHKKTAADINNDGKINPTDALTINRRYVGLISKFGIPDWLFDSPTIVINNASLEGFPKAICAGDVDGSYKPTLKKMSYIDLNYQNEIFVNPGDTFYLPVKITKDVELGAIGIKLKNQNSELEIINLSSNIEGMIYNITGDSVNIAWSALEKPVYLKQNDTLFVLKVISKHQKTQSFQNNFMLIPESIMTDYSGKPYTGEIISMPRITISNKLSAIGISCYPNPFTQQTVISYYLPEKVNVNISVYDMLGKKVATLVNENKVKGNYDVTFDSKNLKSGIYFYKLQAGNYEGNGKMILIK